MIVRMATDLRGSEISLKLSCRRYKVVEESGHGRG